MKLKIRILSLAAAFFVLLSAMPVRLISAAERDPAEPASDSADPFLEETTVPAEEPAEPSEPPVTVLTLNGDIYDAVTDVEYGWDGITYRFGKGILSGVRAGDDVALVADAATQDPILGGAAVTVTLSNYRLEGAHAAYYTLPDLETLPSVQKQIQILKKTVVITPAQTHLYYGQPYPDNWLLTQLVDYTDQLVPGDDIQIHASILIEGGRMEVGVYNISLPEENVTLIGEAAQNYEVVLAPDLQFTVYDFSTDLVAVSPNSPTGDFVGIKTAVLTAPEGFLIGSRLSYDDGDWAKELTISLEETLSGTQVYYLRNNDSGADSYRAVCEKVYHYTSLQTLPAVQSIRLEPLDAETYLHFGEKGVYSGGALSLTVTVKGGPFPQDTDIYLSDRIVSVPAENAVAEDGAHIYTATFYLDANPGEYTETNLFLFAQNATGWSALYPSDHDTFEGTQTLASVPIIIDKIAPAATITQINGSHFLGDAAGAVSAGIVVRDSGAGIAKVEYKWDDGFRLNPEDPDFCTDYVVLEDYSPDREEYELILPWTQAMDVPGNRHTLYLRVMDRAGNVVLCQQTDAVGSDQLAPNIERIEIRKADDSSILQQIIRFLSFGTFFKERVTLVVTVNDNELRSDYYASGIGEVWINNMQATAGENSNEYVLTLSPDKLVDSLLISVTDNCGHRTEAYASDIPENGDILSDLLIVENDSPVIDFGNFLELGHRDAQDRVWFGSTDGETVFTVTASDFPEALCSGLYRVTVMDNDTLLAQFDVTQDDAGTILPQYTVSFPIRDFGDGEHRIHVTAEDNCGNSSSATVTFFMDTAMPTALSPMAVSPAAVELDGNQWFHVNDTLVFRADALDGASGLKNITVFVNDQPFSFYSENIISDETGTYVLATVACSGHSGNRFTVFSQVTDFAGNTVASAPVTVYVDTQAPVITKCTVEKQNTLWDRILNILTFGIYTNDTLIFRVYTADGELDSGIAWATVQHAGMTGPQALEYVGDNAFTFTLSAGSSVFESTLDIVVFDRYGNRSLSCARIEGAEDGKVLDGTYVMIETVPPVLTFEIPGADGIPREDGQIWFNTNKVLGLRVQDLNSGIRHITLTVNGVEVSQDLNGNALLKSAAADAAGQKITNELQYTFDTDYFTAICGIPEDGKYTVSVQITDNSGNILSQEFPYYLDQTPPMIGSIDFSPAAADGTGMTDSFIDTLAYGFFFRSDFHMTVNVSDAAASAGLYEVKYRLVPYQDGAELPQITGSAPIVGGQAQIPVPGGFKGQIFVDAYDLLLNCTGEMLTHACVVDSAAPTVQITKLAGTQYRDAKGNDLFVNDNSLKVVITDTVSGLKQFGYRQNAEQNPSGHKVITLSLDGHTLGENLGDGWTVTGVDANLVTQVEKTFVFDTDDNDISLVFDATDHSLNEIQGIRTETFTIDKTAPSIRVVFREDNDSDLYYAQNRIADITVIERNFDENLINVKIKNTFGSIPRCSFTKVSDSQYTAVINFDEGDYTFRLSGLDMGDHEATVVYSGGNENAFYVDKTLPKVEENFAEFSNAQENSFRVDKTAQIKITEHNFDPSLSNLTVWEQVAGSPHTVETLVDVTDAVLKNTAWVTAGDEHTISLFFDRDAVYYIELRPVDLAGNAAEKCATAVFEIDKTVPVVVRKNGSPVEETATQFLDVYNLDRSGDPIPTVEFGDNNIHCIRYVLTTYVPDYSTSDAVAIDPKVTTGTVDGAVFTLPSFLEDGVYAVELTAVDVAGNESVVNYNTYARLVNQDVLAFILDSNPDAQTGLYSLEYENGDPISKKPSSFKDLNILVMTQEDTPVDIILRDSNGNDYVTNAHPSTDDSIYGFGVYRYFLSAAYFRENFQGDTDMELRLMVLNDGHRIDLAEIHIDNIAPACTLPEGLKDWHWFAGNAPRTFTLTQISEVLDEANCRIYDNGAPIPFTYSAQDRTLTFTLDPGWHNVGIILSDIAGNANNMQELRNMHIGSFWLFVIAGVSAAALVSAVAGILIHRKKRRSAMDD